MLFTTGDEHQSPYDAHHAGNVGFLEELLLRLLSLGRCGIPSEVTLHLPDDGVEKAVKVTAEAWLKWMIYIRYRI